MGDWGKMIGELSAEQMPSIPMPTIDPSVLGEMMPPTGLLDPGSFGAAGELMAPLGGLGGIASGIGSAIGGAASTVGGWLGGMPDLGQMAGELMAPVGGGFGGAIGGAASTVGGWMDDLPNVAQAAGEIFAF